MAWKGASELHTIQQSCCCVMCHVNESNSLLGSTKTAGFELLYFIKHHLVYSVNSSEKLHTCCCASNLCYTMHTSRLTTPPRLYCYTPTA